MTSSTLNIAFLEEDASALVLHHDARAVNSCTNGGDETGHPPPSGSGEEESEPSPPVVPSLMT